MSETPNLQPIERHLALVREAVKALLDDFARTSSVPPPPISVGGTTSVRIDIDGSFTEPSVFATERVALLVETAAYVQEQLSQEIGVWPVCPVHDIGLHAREYSGTPVWWCRLGDHEVAPIGQLGK